MEKNKRSDISDCVRWFFDGISGMFLLSDLVIELILPGGGGG